MIADNPHLISGQIIYVFSAIRSCLMRDSKAGAIVTARFHSVFCDENISEMQEGQRVMAAAWGRSADGRYHYEITHVECEAAT